MRMDAHSYHLDVPACTNLAAHRVADCSHISEGSLPVSSKLLLLNSYDALQRELDNA